jgi:hypothetical protein
VETESEESKTGLSSSEGTLSKGQKLFWIDINDLTNMSDKKMDVDSKSHSDDLCLTREESSFKIDEDI